MLRVSSISSVTVQALKELAIKVNKPCIKIVKLHITRSKLQYLFFLHD